MADIPVLFSKTKLKSLNFATNLTSIFNNFEEETIVAPKPPSLYNKAILGKENCQSNEKKRSREEDSDNEQEKIPSKTQKIDTKLEKKPQKKFDFGIKFFFGDFFSKFCGFQRKQFSKAKYEII